jgi:hypothetical protein
MNRALKSLKMYSFNKDGQNRGERVEDGVSIIHVGQVCLLKLVLTCILLAFAWLTLFIMFWQTFRIMVHPHMFEAKKTVEQTVFPGDTEWINEYSMVEVMINPANVGSAFLCWFVFACWTCADLAIPYSQAPTVATDLTWGV